MTPDLSTILTEATLNVGDKLEAADKLAAVYLRSYAEFYLGPKSTSRYPYAPRGLDPHLAALVRDEVQDAALLLRAGRAA